MNKLFNKIKSYISASAWIQPLLIVVVIFLLLFLLNPIATGVKDIVSCVSTANNVKTITYSEYMNKIASSKEDDKFIIVFTADKCENCKIMNPLMTKYIKSHTETDYEIYSVDLSTKKDSKGNKIYKDSTLGVADLSDADYAKLLDTRLGYWQDSAIEGATALIDVKSTTGAGVYTYLGTPLLLWYEGGIEVKVANALPSDVVDDSQSSYSAFCDFMKFPEIKDSSSQKYDLDEWASLHPFTELVNAYKK